ncbi:type IIG restriction enzyme/methyltransferase [Paraburkholderia adhaesiva]|uniref:type IIG restriction enzyme/methyltransferase n=1 Tax=Paraburkholderia adhaesiva TaxID=2883244 RepID=UPI001F24C87D|nr:Eco57I restriction-modification methylase domain-containing protein [Paraburkholderia adhaesiva]
MPETKPKKRARSRRAALDEAFYAELLHIAGLCETVANGKPAIVRQSVHERLRGSLIENALARMEAHTIEQFADAAPSSREAQRFGIALRFCIAWICQLVFLKLLEARLLTLHDNDPAYAFLRSDRIRSFAELDARCREVLGGDDTATRVRLERIPRLPGAFFDPRDSGTAPTTLGALDDDPPLPLFARSVLIQADGAPRTGARAPVTYLLDFLDAFDFSSRAPHHDTPRKRRIDAATPGLIFEKLNGYRDGAWFTPGRVATLMCRSAIESAVLRRFNRTKGWHCETIDKLCESIDDLDEARSIVDSLCVCDPAVGSGHLLVSALNECVALKSRLRLLTGLDGKPLTGYDIEVVADRLIVKRATGEALNSREETRRLDEVLFREKCAIVENGLYGVDLNADAVQMTRLRLWAELLEHAGYDEHGCFFRLPDLTANIKCGNATISRFDMDAILRGAPVEKRQPITCDRQPVSQPHRAYAANHIAQAPDAFNERLRPRASETRDHDERVFENAFEWRIEFPAMLDNDGSFRGFDAVIANPPYIDSERMVNEGQQDVRAYLAQRWPAAKGNWDLYVVFMELGLSLLARDGAMACLTPDKWLSKPFGDAFRALHLSRIERIVTLGRDVFDEALVDSIVTIYANSGTETISTARLDGDTLTPLASVRQASLSAPWRLDALLSPHYAFARRIEASHPRLGSLLACENACATSDAYRLKPLIEEAKGRFSPRRHYRVVNTGTLDRFVSRWAAKPMTYLGDRYHEPVVERTRFAAEFANGYRAKADAKKVIVKGLTRLDATLDLTGDVIPGKTTLMLRSDDEDLLKFVAAVINSPLAAFYLRACYPSSSYNGGIAFTKAMIDSVPVPGSATLRTNVVRLVDRLIELSEVERHADHAAISEAIAQELDDELYKAFGLSLAEIACVEGTLVARKLTR